MKVLVSAYACNPYLGSEPGVGWTALCRIARKHDVWALVHKRHKEGWDQARKEGLIPSNVQVRFLGKNRPWHPNRLLAHLQSWRSYSAFCKEVLDAAVDWHDEVEFDLCHHVTIATWRVTSPLWQMPIPFIWGPIGGAGHIPPAFRSMLSPLARGFEKLRDINTSIALRGQDFEECVQGSSVVFAANEETVTLLKPHRGEKPLVHLPIASIPEEKIEQFRRSAGMDTSEGPLRLFAGGNMEGRKGVSLALKALAKVAAEGVDFQYTVAGGGPEWPALKKLAGELGLNDKVEFHSGYRGADYINVLHQTHVYFLPSFRESTPVTLLESYLAGCYPVVADTSAQGEIVNKIGGTAVTVETMDGLIDGLAEAVIECDRKRDSLFSEITGCLPNLTAFFSSERYDGILADAYALAMGGASDSGRSGQ